MRNRVALGLLQAAALIVPGEDRTDWLAEWRGELWHVAKSGHCIAFAAGAFYDALWLRRNRLRGANEALGDPRRCLCLLGSVAILSLLLALCLPLGGRGGQLLVVSRPIPVSDYRALAAAKPAPLHGLAFYRMVPGRLKVAVATDSMRKLLGIPEAHPGGRQAYVSATAWRTHFAANPAIRGSIVDAAGQPAVVAGIVDLGHWQLPEQVDIWVFGDDIGSKSVGYAVTTSTNRDYTRFGRSVFFTARDGQGRLRSFIAARPDLPFQSAVFGFLTMTGVALFLLPILTSVSLGEYPAGVHRKRLAFLTLRVLLLCVIAAAGAVDVSFALTFISTGPGLAILASTAWFATSFATLRWLLRDQRRRCPACLHLVTYPVQVGQVAHCFVDWDCTELACPQGHGLLHVPGTSTSWQGTQRWSNLDPSWNVLFAEARR